MLGSSEREEPAAPPPATTAESPPDEPAPEPVPPPLATGLSERNANLLRAEAGPPDFEPWRERVEALRPRFYRLVVDWAQLQPDPSRPPDLAKPDTGCLRDLEPCGAFAGIRDVLRAVRAQQQAAGGWEVVVTLFGAPEWAARRPGGCERSTELPRSRPFNRRGFEGYRALVRELLRVAGEEGVELTYWAPWNEPNQPFFLSPQRARCDARGPSLAVRTYSRIVRALRAELAAQGGERKLVLGELAAASGPGKLVTGVDEFIRALPDADACEAAVWSQHEYVERDRDGGDAVAEMRRALDARECTRGMPIWVTETGVGGAHVGAKRSLSPAELRTDCRVLARSLGRWGRDPRVEAAFQYTFREDTLFPVGLADARLSREYPVYELWRDWADGQGSARACDG